MAEARQHRRRGRPIGIVPLRQDRGRFAVAVVATMGLLPGWPRPLKERARLVSFLFDDNARAGLEISPPDHQSGFIAVGLQRGTLTTLPESSVEALAAKVRLTFDRIHSGAYAPADCLWMGDSTRALAVAMAHPDPGTKLIATMFLGELGWNETLTWLVRKVQAGIISPAN